MLDTSITFEGVKGVGTIALDLQPDKQVYTLIGANGVGKTKTLEALFQILFFTKDDINKLRNIATTADKWVFKSMTSPSLSVATPSEATLLTNLWLQHKVNRHSIPTVFLASQNRGFIEHKNTAAKPLGSLEQRRDTYVKRVINTMSSNFSSLNMDVGIEEWFITLAQSSNRYQSQADNREVELTTVLKLLHAIDKRIDATFIEVSGDGRVSLKIDGQKRELSHLSTGFASILKMIQAIVSGYGYFTNETQLQNVRGIVLIDEIESHLHLSWQAHIIPLLKRLFPNTTFYITTHSSIVLSQLEEGEAYRLERNDDGVVRTHLIQSPDKAAMVDVLKDAFGIDFNQMKRDRMSAEKQQDAKKRLLSLINQ